MHEVAAIRQVINTALEQMVKAKATRITALQLAANVSDHVSEEAIRQLFGSIAAGTAAEQASLNISWLSAKYLCINCRLQFESQLPVEEATCPACGGSPMELSLNPEIYLSTVEVAFDLDFIPNGDGASSG